MAERVWFCVEAATFSATAKMREKPVDLRFAHFCRVTFVVEHDETTNPANVSFFGTQAVMPCPNGVTHAIEEFGRLGRRQVCRSWPLCR